MFFPLILGVPFVLSVIKSEHSIFCILVAASFYNCRNFVIAIVVSPIAGRRDNPLRVKLDMVFPIP